MSNPIGSSHLPCPNSAGALVASLTIFPFRDPDGGGKAMSASFPDASNTSRCSLTEPAKRWKEWMWGAALALWFSIATSKGITSLTHGLDGLSHSVKGRSSFPPDQSHQLYITSGNISDDWSGRATQSPLTALPNPARKAEASPFCTVIETASPCYQSHPQGSQGRNIFPPRKMHKSHPLVC